MASKHVPPFRHGLRKQRFSTARDKRSVGIGSVQQRRSILDSDWPPDCEWVRSNHFASSCHAISGYCVFQARPRSQARVELCHVILRCDISARCIRLFASVCVQRLEIGTFLNCFSPLPLSFPPHLRPFHLNYDYSIFNLVSLNSNPGLSSLETDAPAVVAALAFTRPRTIQEVLNFSTITLP